MLNFKLVWTLNENFFTEISFKDPRASFEGGRGPSPPPPPRRKKKKKEKKKERKKRKKEKKKEKKKWNYE